MLAPLSRHAVEGLAERLRRDVGIALVEDLRHVDGHVEVREGVFDHLGDAYDLVVLEPEVEGPPVDLGCVHYLYQTLGHALDIIQSDISAEEPPKAAKEIVDEATAAGHGNPLLPKDIHGRDE